MRHKLEGQGHQVPDNAKPSYGYHFDGNGEYVQEGPDWVKTEVTGEESEDEDGEEEETEEDGDEEMAEEMEGVETNFEPDA